jgi:GNAT superfamily N-acetyltransferase
MPAEWEIIPFEREHDRHDFDCGVQALNEYLARYARQHEDSGISRTFVAVDRRAPSKILGYYSLAAGSIDRAALPLSAAKRFPKFPIPVGRLARLAVDLRTRGLGLGEHILMDALHRFFRTGDSIGMVAVFVDAKDEQAKRFYQRYEFDSLPDHPLTLWLPMKSVKKLFRGR